MQATLSAEAPRPRAPWRWRRPVSRSCSRSGGLDYFIYKNVIGAAVAVSVLLGAGMAASRAGMVLGVALCALSLGVVAATAWEPKYQT